MTDRDIENQLSQSREMKLAAEIQRTLLPRQPAEIPGLEIDVLATPSREVGGDYWDVIPPGEGRWSVVVADVSGKGVAAGIVASNLQTRLWSRRGDDVPLAVIIASVNAGHLPLLIKRDADFLEFGFDRIDGCPAGADGPPELIESLDARLKAHLEGREVGDDVTLLCFRYTGNRREAEVH